jgi:hypothetical protein
VKTIASFSGCAYGDGRSSSELTALKIAVLTPMPNASVSAAMKVKPGCLRNTRAP